MENPPAVPDGDEHRRGRWLVLRDVTLFQAKLFVDGLKDLVLMPLSLAAATMGLLGAGHPARHLHEVLRWGRSFDRWINLFGAIEPPPERPDELAPRNVDSYFARLEQAIVEQHRRGGITAQAKDAIDRALDALQRDRPGTPASEDDGDGPAAR